MQEEISRIKDNFSNDVSQINKNNFQEYLDKYLGRKGLVANLFNSLGTLSSDDKKIFGAELNSLKKQLTDSLENIKSSFENKSYFEHPIDGSLPLYEQGQGSNHMITHALFKFYNIFKKMGFVLQRYPEVEYEWNSFDALNMSKDAPARDSWETFFIDDVAGSELGKRILTPHTSSGQVREMSKGELPIKMINISKVYRRQVSSRHVPMFYQSEGLAIAEGLTLTDLKGTLERFLTEFLGEDTKFRYRPHNFKFTEPSFEIDVSCRYCGGVGCKLCKQGWVEVLGTGMVHPNVLRNCNIDPNKYSGFAFGIGIERLTSMSNGINIEDIRVMYNDDYAFLKNFI